MNSYFNVMNGDTHSIGIEIQFFQRSFVNEHIRWYIIEITVIQLQLADVFFLGSQTRGALPPSATHFMCLQLQNRNIYQ